MANSKPQRKLELEEKRSELWRSHRETLPPGPWTSVQAALHRLLNELQPQYGVHPLPFEHRPPAPVIENRQSLWWWKAVAFLTCGTIPNVVFISTKYGQPRIKCPSHDPGTQMSCYDAPEYHRLRSTINYVDWDRINRIRTQDSYSNTCPGIARAFAISNSDGHCVLIDLLRIGGIPDAIKELLFDTAVDKISFDLAHDLPVLQATILGFEHQHSIAFRDASFQHRIRRSHGDVTRANQRNWASTTDAIPTLTEVFLEWTVGRDCWYGTERALDFTGSLSDILDVITGNPSTSGHANNDLAWFLRRPPNLYDDNNKDAIYYRQSILTDAIATSVVYISSLWLREDWRQGQNTSNNVIDWLGTRLPPSLGPQPPPFGQYFLGLRNERNDRQEEPREDRRTNSDHQWYRHPNDRRAP